MAQLVLNVNGRKRRTQAAPDERLLWVLRDRLGLTGTKYGCGEGECGACTVLLDGQPVRSCQWPAQAAVGHPIVTIEGLASNQELHPVQEAFLQAQALQCGYCTSGMVLAVTALLQTNPHPTDAAIIAALDGNLCRCGTYPRILQAVHWAAARLAGKKSA